MPTNRILSAVAVAIALPLSSWAQQPAPSAAPGGSSPAPAAAAAAAPGAPAPAPEPPPTEAERLIDEAVAKIRAYSSISAGIVEHVEMLGQKFRLEGLYRKAPGNKHRLTLKLVGLGDTTGTVVQVCNGTTLFDYQNVLEQPVCHKITIGPILKRLESPDVTPELRDAIMLQFNLAGPEVLLTGLRKAVTFDQKAEETYDGRPVWVLRGRWKDRASLTGPKQPPLPQNGPLPPYVPSLTTVWLDKETGWPYEVKLEGRVLSIMERKSKKDDVQRGPDGRPIGRPTPDRDEKPSKIDLIYSGVQFNTKLGSETFYFEPPSGVSVQDQTEAITTALDNNLANIAAAKRAAAAKSSEGATETTPPIEVPKLGPEQKK